MRGRKEAGNALRSTILAGSCFVSLVEIQGFGSGSSRILGLRVGKNQFFFLVPFFYLVPCVFWAWGLKNFLLHLSDLHRKCQGIKLELCPIEIGDIALSSGCGSTKHCSVLRCDRMKTIIPKSPHLLVDALVKLEIIDVVSAYKCTHYILQSLFHQTQSGCADTFSYSSSLHLQGPVC